MWGQSGLENKEEGWVMGWEDVGQSLGVGDKVSLLACSRKARDTSHQFFMELLGTYCFPDMVLSAGCIM